jgi:hypothetical protein
LTHVAGDNFVYIRNSLVVGAITPNDCGDIADPTTLSAMYAPTAVPTVSATSSDGDPGGRSGIVFPYIFGGGNEMPIHPWTGIDAYPCGKSKFSSN